MSGFLSFLDDVLVENVEPKAPRAGAKKQRNPGEDFVGIRLWSDGSVYPSKTLVDRFNLEYPAATVSTVKGKDGADNKVYTVVGNQGNGIDVIDAREWGQLTAKNKNFVAVAFSPKDAPKIDLFGMTRFDEEGKPVTSVLEQGTVTFGKKELLPLVKELYNIEPGEEGYIDLQVATEEAGGKNLKSSNGLEYLPKKVARGEDKGKADYAKRENVDIFMLYPVVEETPDAIPDQVATDTSVADGLDGKAEQNGQAAVANSANVEV